MLAELIFWASVFFTIYTYIGYPIAIAVISLFVDKQVKSAQITPFVSVVISAYNEEKDIANKIMNCLQFDYPKDKYEIIVASDGSDDATDDIVRQFVRNSDNVNVVLHRVEGRKGKTAAQNSAVKICKGDIVVFSDAASMYHPGSIRALVRNYADEGVGAVSGKYDYLEKAASSAGLGTILFWKLENFIKCRQTKINTITGCCGCIYSVRKALYTDLPAEIISDLVEPLTIIKKGYRIAFEPDATALEETAGDTKDEFKMRIRVIVRGMNGIIFMRELMNFMKYPFVAFQLFSHKVLRWLVPVFMILIFLTSFMLKQNSFFFSLIFYLQVLLYFLAVIGFFLERKGIHKAVCYIPLYFCTVNLASLISIFKVMLGQNIVVWQTKR